MTGEKEIIDNQPMNDSTNNLNNEMPNDEMQEQEVEQTTQKDENTQKIESLEKQVEQMKELAQRTQAEFMNYKKRIAKEKQDLTVFANEKIIMEMLSVVDNFQRALDSEMDKETGFYQGVDLIKKELESVLARNGLEEIEAINQPFDPNYHHAVMQIETEDEPNTVVEVLQKGYKLKEKVIRPVMVKVSK